MMHALIAPILLPLGAGCVLLLVRDNAVIQRAISLLACLALLMLAVFLLRESTLAIHTYRLGNWIPPFGIVLVLDRLSALMLLTNSILALLVLWYACAGDDRHGRFFHALFQFQLVGINGAFLTGDLFNLFVFFEILLIASYGLLLHGSNPTLTNDNKRSERVSAGVPYVVLNLVGSALFLFAAGIFYGVAGTLNFADLARFMTVSNHAGSLASIAPLLMLATLLLLLVFGLKAALVPLHFWLPRSYSVASAPVAALFAIMSKIGIYALLRTQTLMLGSDSALHALLTPWLYTLGVMTIVIGAIGALAATALTELVAYMVIVSIGTLTLALALDSISATTALLYYLLHSTWIGAGMFLLAAQIDRYIDAGISLRYRRLLATLFLCGAMALIGVPPLSGFIGKLLLLQSAIDTARGWIWSSVLLSSLAALIVFSRIGTLIFWKTEATNSTGAEHSSFKAISATTVLLSLSIVLSASASPIVKALSAAAQQLFEPQRYISAVLSPAEQQP